MSGGLRDFEEETPVEEKAPHVEFVSQVESLLSHPCTELCFDPTPGFGDLKGFFPKEAISHPAKINIHFLRYLITRYTNLGDTILDPLAGSGSTAVVGTLLDRNAITIELEDKFFEWENGVDCDGWTCYAIGCYKRRSMEEEIPKLKKALEGINEPVNFSRLVWKDAPNEGSPLLDLGASPKDAIEIYEKFKNLSDLEERYNRLPKKPHHFTGSREFVDGASTVFKGKWSAIKGDARNLPELVGQVGISISSPPYEGSEAFQDTDFVQKISGDLDERILEGKTKGHLKQPFRTLKYKTGAHISQGHAPSSEAEGRYMERAEAGRITHPDSLGKLHKETYLEAMRVVYFGMFQVLKPGGRAVIIVKPFSREKKVVDLPWQTWLLMQSCGFEFEDTVKLRLKNLSFWRVLQYKKNPGLEQIRHEYAVVCHKPLVVESK
jgi:hypothetical protein